MTVKKVAFIHFPHNPSSARLETMPFALNTVTSLEKIGWKIDLFLWEGQSHHYDNLFSDGIKVYYQKLIGVRKLRYLGPSRFWMQFRVLPSRYDYVFGVGQIGAYIAALIAQSSHCPWIYMNDEFASCWDGESIHRGWAAHEINAAKSAAIIIAPDEQRIPELKKELGLPDKKYVALPNIPSPRYPVKEINWRSLLGLPENVIPFLHAGSVADWAQIPELLSSVPYWPENTVLIIHSRSSQGLEDYKRSLAHLDVPGRVYWSMSSLDEASLNSLVYFCAGSFALYRNTGPNIDLAGFSSGKLMRSIAYERPVIASRLTSFKFIEDFELGVLVDHPAEIPAAIDKISTNPAMFSQNCSHFCRSKVSFEKSWADFFINLTAI
ncbi:MAG: hypothetical protein ACHWZW_21725 [Spirulina sp.]